MCVPLVSKLRIDHPWVGRENSHHYHAEIFPKIFGNL